MEAGPPDMRPMMRSIAMTATGDFLLFIGVVFTLWGVADFATGFLKIQGGGQIVVGIVLILLALFLLVRSRQMIPGVPAGAPSEAKKKKETRSEDYR